MVLANLPLKSPGKYKTKAVVANTIRQSYLQETLDTQCLNGNLCDEELRYLMSQNKGHCYDVLITEKPQVHNIYIYIY